MVHRLWLFERRRFYENLPFVETGEQYVLVKLPFLIYILSAPLTPRRLIQVPPIPEQKLRICLSEYV